MNFEKAKELVSDKWYQRLCRDLERGSRRRKITPDQYFLVEIVLRLPKNVPEDRWKEIDQVTLNEAHHMADLIRSSFGAGLVYDYDDRPIVYHGSYGSRH